jgi:dihydroflavonol-4-reductase
LAAISGRRSVLIPVPGRIAETAAAILELIADRVTHKAPSGTAEGVRIASRARALSIEKAQRELGYAPRPVESALRETVLYLLGTEDDRYEPGSSPDRHARSFHPNRRYGV